MSSLKEFIELTCSSASGQSTPEKSLEGLFEPQHPYKISNLTVIISK
jgi:energy-coupling factor transporter ATP-binding protein EcfA2